MLRRERQQQILIWLEEEGALRVSDISKRLAVSTVTAYNDIKPLVEQQLILKSLNGIFYIPKKNHASSYVCSYCNKQSKVKLHSVGVRFTGRDDLILRSAIPRLPFLF